MTGDCIAALSASPAPSGQGVSGEVAKCLTPGCKYRTEIKTSYAHSSYGPARLGITVFFPDWQSLKAGSAKEVSHIETVLHTHMERAVSEIGQYDLSLGGDVAKDWPVSAAPAPSCAPGEVERLVQALRDVVNPLGYLQRMAEAEGSKLGGMAYAIANDISTVQRIASKALATPSQRLDAATVERCAQVASEDMTPGYGPHRADMEALADIQRNNIAARIRALATEPHQHDK